jgi:hypothetical protein
MTDGLRAPALAFGDPRVTALLAALLLFTHTVDDLSNRQLVKLVARLWPQPSCHDLAKRSSLTIAWRQWTSHSTTSLTANSSPPET